MNNEKSLAQQRDEERMANAAPRRDAGATSEADMWNGVPQNRDDARVREVKAAQFKDWFKRRFARVPTESELTNYLDNGVAF